MKKNIIIVILLLVLGGGIYYFFWSQENTGTKVETNHQFLLERVESLGKLELIKYRISDVIEHTHKTAYLPEASVILIIKADAVGCIDLQHLPPENITVYGDSVSMVLPQPELCYIKINHDESRVYDTKMAFFREATLVDEAYKVAESEIRKEVSKSDLMAQTRKNGKEVIGALLQGLGFTKVSITFE